MLLVVLGSLLLTAVLLLILSVRGLHRLGEFSLQAAGRDLERQARARLIDQARERALRHEAAFQAAADNARTVAERAIYFLDHLEQFGSSGPDGPQTLTWSPTKGMFHNGPDALVSSVYWDKKTLGPQVRRRLNAVSHVDGLLDAVRRRTEGAAAAWLMLADTIVRYSPNIVLVDVMPPTWEFDYRDDHCFQLGLPQNNPLGRAVWSEVYEDSVGQGLVVTVAVPLYSAAGKFLGTTGIDLSLGGIVREVLGRAAGEGAAPPETAGPGRPEGWFELLVDRDGRLVAAPMDRLRVLGLKDPGARELSPGEMLRYRLADSGEADVRALAEEMTSGRQGVRRLRLGGRTWLAASHPMGGTGWSLAELVPLDSMLLSMDEARNAQRGEIRSIVLDYPFVALVVILMSLALTLSFILRRMLRPMRELRLATKAVAAGRRDSEVHIPHGDEFGELGQAFNAMIRDLARQEERLRDAEEKYRSIFEGAVEGIYRSTPQGVFLGANQAMSRALGYASPEELMREVHDIPEQIYVDPADRERFFERLRTGGEVLQFETRLRRKDGGIIWARLGGRAVFDSQGEMLYVNGILEDYTDAKHAREEIRRLSQELMRTQERERGRIARDLHDGVAQTLSSLKIAAGVLFDGHPEVPEELRRRAEEFSSRLQECITAVRGMAYDLHPSSLDELGLVRTMEQYCREFSERTGIRVEFMAAGLDGVRLAQETEINLYRLAQEALHNVEKHSGADAAGVRLVASHPRVILRVSDNGRGFDPEGLPPEGLRRRMGLRSMEERARLLGGWMEVAAQPGRGTRIKVEVPGLPRRED